MTVDVIIPCAGSARYVGETVMSVLNQTPAADAIYLVDNACDHDGYREAAEKSGSDRVHFVRFGERLTLTMNWQRCLGVGSSDLCMLLNDDDSLQSDALAVGISLLEQSPASSCVLLPRIYLGKDGEHFQLNEPGKSLPVIDGLEEPARSFYLCTCSLGHMSALIFRRGSLGFFPQLRWMPDQGYLFAHAAMGGVALAHVGGTIIRQHEDSMTSSFHDNGRTMYEERSYLRTVIEFFVEERGLTAIDLEGVAGVAGKYYFRNLVRACFSWPWRRSRMKLGTEVLRNRRLRDVLKRDLTKVELLWPAVGSTLASFASDLKYFAKEKRLRS